MDRSFRQKVHKESIIWNAVDQTDLPDVYRMFQPIAEHTFISCTPRTFSRLDPLLGHKTSLHKFKEAEITWSIFSDHSVISSLSHCLSMLISTYLWIFSFSFCYWFLLSFHCNRRRYLLWFQSSKKLPCFIKV